MTARSGGERREAGADAPGRTIWLDTDIALGAKKGDVDDGFALAALFGAAAAGAVRILGISTGAGNTSAAESARCARALAAAAGSRVEIVEGAPAETGRGAADAIAGLPAEAELLALAPLGNIAAACRRDAELPGRTAIRVVGARLASRGFLPPLWPWEFNLARGAAAARFVLSRPWRRLVFFPLDVVCRLRADRALLEELETLSPTGRLLAEGSRRWLARARWLRFSASFALWDAVAALDAIGRLDARIEPRRLAPAMRRYLGLPEPQLCLVDFDAAAAKTALVELVRRCR